MDQIHKASKIEIRVDTVPDEEDEEHEVNNELGNNSQTPKTLEEKMSEKNLYTFTGNRGGGAKDGFKADLLGIKP